MEKISFKCCPICGGELDTGKVQFPASRSIFEVIDAEGKFYSDKTTEANENHRIKKLFQTCDKSFTIQMWGRENNSAGYCGKCNRIFLEFEADDENEE